MAAATALDVDQLAERVTSLFADVPRAQIVDVEQIVGGASSLTYSARLRHDDRDRAIVIKAAPPGLEPVRNRDVLRQARVLDVLGGVPDVAVPEVLATDVGQPVEVPPLFVMSFVEGESYEPQLTPAESDATHEQIAQRAFAAARMAAALHRVDTDDARLRGEQPIDLEHEVRRWDRAFSSVDDDLRSGADDVRDALLATLPPGRPPAVIHGDWRLGNMQCTGSTIHAVIDWEIWSLGDPRIDVSWFLLLIDPAHPNKIRDDTGLPTAPQLVAAYEDAAGTRLVDLDWFAGLVRYKQAAVSALIIKNNRKLPQPGIDIARMEQARPTLLEDAAALLA
jgi:aminoglycoside phosphotransferase (APT) family kinase protein